MYKCYLTFIFSILFIFGISAQDITKYPQQVQKLMKAYPDKIKAYDGTYIVMDDDSIILYKESDNRKSHIDLLNSNALSDVFAYPYVKGTVVNIAKNQDAGRIRNEELLKKMYGSTSVQVQKHLVTITWCPKLVNQKLQITSVNGVDRQLQKISDELDQHPELKDYLLSAGTFNWRKVRGADRLSAHSFGTAIDIAIKYSNYWQWDCKCNNEEMDLKYKNKIPQLIVDIFEKHGFIWGGKWYHYDTMHFEYRPELLVD